MAKKARYYIETRRTGRSNRIILSVLQEMSENPGSWVFFADHTKHHHATEYHMPRLRQCCEALGMHLEHKRERHGFLVRITDKPLKVYSDGTVEEVG